MPVTRKKIKLVLFVKPRRQVQREVREAESAQKPGCEPRFVDRVTEAMGGIMYLG
jgi:hypothetical protein